MSSVEPSTGGTEPRPPEPADVAVDGHQIPADPLLQPGTFIDATEPTLTEQQPAQNEVSGARESSDEPDEQAPPVADPSAVDSADSTPSKLKGTPKASGAMDSTPERPDWLPEGWRMDCKIRTSGATAGSMDRGFNLNPFALTSPWSFDPSFNTGVKMPIAADINVASEERNSIVEKMRLQLLGPSHFANNKPSFSIDLNVIPEEEKTMGQEREVGFVDLSSFGSHQLASPLDRNVIQFKGKFVAEGQVQSLDEFFITNQNPRITNQNPRINIDLNTIPEEAEFATGGEQYTTSKVGSRRRRINRLMVNATTMPMLARRRKRCPLMSASSFFSPEIPSRWGVGWQIDYRVRYSGASAGKVDKYYVELESGRRFRSRKEVEYYREHGTIRKKKKGAQDAGAGAADVNSPADQEAKPKPPPKKKAKKTVAPANFDYNDVPEMVQWRLTDASGDTWTPYVGGDKVVSATTKKEWDSAFRFSCGL